MQLHSSYLIAVAKIGNMPLYINSPVQGPGEVQAVCTTARLASVMVTASMQAMRPAAGMVAMRMHWGAQRMLQSVGCLGLSRLACSRSLSAHWPPRLRRRAALISAISCTARLVAWLPINVCFVQICDDHPLHHASSGRGLTQAGGTCAQWHQEGRCRAQHGGGPG